MGENFLLFSQENSKSQSLMWTYTYVYDKCEFSDMFEYTKVKNMNSSCNSVVWKISTNFFLYLFEHFHIFVCFLLLLCVYIIQLLKVIYEINIFVLDTSVLFMGNIKKDSVIIWSLFGILFLHSCIHSKIFTVKYKNRKY